MRLFNSERVAAIMERLNIPGDVPVESKVVTRAIRSAQTQVEQQNFEIRKDVLKYDDVLNRQRKVIYGERRTVLEGADLHEQIREMVDEVVAGYVAGETADGYPEEWDLDKLWRAFRQLFPISISVDDVIEEAGGERAGLSGEFITEAAIADAQSAYERREEEFGSEVMRELERRVVLSVLDRKWREHLYEMDYLREGIGLRGYGQRDPLVEYQREGYDMFGAMMDGIKEESVGNLFNLKVEVQENPIVEEATPDGSASPGAPEALAIDTPEAASPPRPPPRVSPVPAPPARTPAAAPRPAASGPKAAPRSEAAPRSKSTPGTARPGPGLVARTPSPRRARGPRSRPGWDRAARSGWSTRRRRSTAGRTWRRAGARPPGTSTAGLAATTRARADRAASSSAATVTRGTRPDDRPPAQRHRSSGIDKRQSARRQPASSAVHSQRAGRAGQPGAAGRAAACSKRMARARERAPKFTTTVISTTRSAGRDITMRAILGRRPAASSGARFPTRARTRSVASETSCRSGRTPASTSTITTAS